MKPAQRKDKILILRFSALGDVAMTIPIVYQVCHTYPQSCFIFITKKSVGNLFVNAPDNLTVIPIDTNRQYSGIKGIWKLYKDLRNENITHIADLHNVLRTRILDMLIRCTSQVKCCILDKGRHEKRCLTSRHKKYPISQLRTSFDRYAKVFETLGFDVNRSFQSIFDNNKPDLPVSDGIEPPRPGEKWIGIAPFAKHPGKILPPEKMEKIIENLSKRDNCRIFLMGGGESETIILQDWAQKYPSTHSLAGERLGFAKELALISRMSFVVSMDSANMHLASLVGVPVISIWGQTHPFAGFLGWKQKEENIIQAELTCRPCSIFGNKPCMRNDYACLHNIDPEDIIKRIDRLLQENQIP